LENVRLRFIPQLAKFENLNEDFNVSGNEGVQSGGGGNFKFEDKFAKLEPNNDFDTNSGSITLKSKMNDAKDEDFKFEADDFGPDPF